MDKSKILIVDDDLPTRQALNLRLRANGYDTAFAPDAIAAVSEARRIQPDLVLLDLGLPGGDGFRVIERLRAIAAFGSLPIVVLSAREPAVNEERALAAGAAAFLQKPADNDALLAAIRRALGATLEA
jgi:DNA-binding response OmpR family regulator